VAQARLAGLHRKGFNTPLQQQACTNQGLSVMHTDISVPSDTQGNAVQGMLQASS
jgi:hypothetical protein